MPRFQSALATPPPPRPAATGVRGTLDSLVQGSLVDLFSAYSVALAPLPRSSRPLLLSSTDISASVTFSRPGGGQVGRITLSVPALVLDDMSRGAASTLRTDWARELANQLTGRVKNRLLQFNVRLQVGSSIVVDTSKANDALQQTLGRRTYAARTLRGQVVVSAEGLPDDNELTYVGAGTVAVEGDTILF